MTQVPQHKFTRGMSVADMHHKRLDFVSVAFKGAQTRCPIVDRETFTMVSFVMYCDHLNLAYISQPNSCKDGAPTWGSFSTRLPT